MPTFSVCGGEGGVEHRSLCPDKSKAYAHTFPSFDFDIASRVADSASCNTNDYSSEKNYQEVLRVHKRTHTNLSHAEV